jgi:hypothetical protein
MAFIECMRDKLCCSGNNDDDLVSSSNLSLSQTQSRALSSTHSKRSRRQRSSSSPPSRDSQRSKYSHGRSRRSVSRDDGHNSRRSRSKRRQEENRIVLSNTMPRHSSVEMSQHYDGPVPVRDHRYPPPPDNDQLLHGGDNNVYPETSRHSYPQVILSAEDGSTEVVADQFVSRSNRENEGLDIPGEITVDTDNLSVHGMQLSKLHNDRQLDGDFDIDRAFSSDYTQGIVKGLKSRNDRQYHDAKLINTRGRPTKSSLFKSLFKGSSSDENLASRTDQEVKRSSSSLRSRNITKGFKIQEGNDEIEQREWIQDMERNNGGNYTRTRSIEQSSRPLYVARDVSPLCNHYSPRLHWTMVDDDGLRQKDVRFQNSGSRGRGYVRERSPGIDDPIHNHRHYPVHRGSKEFYYPDYDYRRSSSRGYMRHGSEQPRQYEGYYVEDGRRVRGTLYRDNTLSQEAIGKRNHRKNRLQRKKTQVRVISVKRSR